MHISNKYRPFADSRGKWFKRRRNSYDKQWDHNFACRIVSWEAGWGDYPDGILRDENTHEYILNHRRKMTVSNLDILLADKPEWVACNSKFGYYPMGESTYIKGAVQKPNGAWHSCRSYKNVRRYKKLGNRSIRRMESRELRLIQSGLREDFESSCIYNSDWYE